MLRLEYPGFHGCHCVCGLEVKVLGDRRYEVVLTELNENQGTSVTNMVEDLATAVKQNLLADVPPENITWIEHYEHSSLLGGETFDYVEMKWDGQAYWQPKWRPKQRPELVSPMGGSE